MMHLRFFSRLRRILPRFTRLTFLTAALCGGWHSAPSLAEYQLLDQAVAIVEDDIILASEVRDTMYQISQTLKQRRRPVPPNDVLYEQVLEKLILDSLQLQRAREAGLRIIDQQLNEAMANFAASKGATLDQFRESIIARGESYTNAREQIRKELLIQQIQRRSVFRKIHIDDTEVTNFLASEEGLAILTPELNLDHVLIALDSNASAAAKQRAEQRAQQLRALALSGQKSAGFASLSDQLARFGAERSDLGWRKLDEVPSIFEDYVQHMQAGDISEPIFSDSGYHLVWLVDKKGGIDAQVNETNVRHILISPNEIRTEFEAKNEALAIKQRLDNGESFVDLARIHSDDPGSALAGGDLGWSEPGKFVPVFENTMNNTEIGSISEPFQSEFGWHILEVLDRRTADHSEDRAKRAAQMAIADKKYDDALQNWLQELRDNAYIEMK